MLSVVKLSPGQEAYYAASVADGLDDYYAGRGEAPGIWHGRGAEALGLVGVVSAEQLRAIVRAVDPLTGKQLRAHAPRRTTRVERIDPVTGERYTVEQELKPVAGFDLVFAAPKSVSILHALGGDDVRDAIRRAHESAWQAAVGYLEQEACVVRRGRAGAIREPGTGLVAAAFPHRTSRAQDPHLHTHVVVANLGQGSDGRWRALDGVPLLQTHRLAAGYLYQAHLRAELGRTLGATWTPTTTGQAELATVPSVVLAAFSQRRAQLVAHLEETGGAGWHAAQAAAVRTRARKEPLDLPRLTEEWTARAAEHGLDRSGLQAIAVADAPWRRPERSELRGILADLLGEEGLTARRAAFGRHDAIMAIAERLPAGAPADYVVRLADALLASTSVVRLGDDAPGRPGTFTTTAVVEAERDLLAAIDAIAASRHRPAPPGPLDRIVRSHAATSGLSDAQAAAAQALAGSAAGLGVMVGAAGSGKTSTLAAAAAALDYAGYTVIGAAPSAVAARQLERAAGIPSRTLHAVAAELDRRPLPRRTCLVIDEAGMADSRTLGRVLDGARRASARVILVGDPEQLSAVGAGGAFAAIVERPDTVRLDETHRQHDPAERTALGRLRAGEADSYLAHAVTNARVHLTETPHEAVELVVRDWWEHGRAAPADNVMIALRRDQVDALNAAARERMARAGRLGPAITTQAGDSFAVGDRVVLRRNDHARGLVNGERGTVTGIDRDGLVVRDDRGATRRLPVEYVEARHVRHGYAITGHQAQGTTVDRAFVLAPDSGKLKEWGYVALSRARLETHVTMTTSALDEHDAGARLGGFMQHLEARGREEMATRSIALGRGLSR